MDVNIVNLFLKEIYSNKIIQILKLFARFLSEWKSVKTWIKLFKKPHKTNNNNNI